MFFCISSRRHLREQQVIGEVTMYDQFMKESSYVWRRKAWSSPFWIRSSNISCNGVHFERCRYFAFKTKSPLCSRKEDQNVDSRTKTVEGHWGHQQPCRWAPPFSRRPNAGSSAQLGRHESGKLPLLLRCQASEECWTKSSPSNLSSCSKWSRLGVRSSLLAWGKRKVWENHDPEIATRVKAAIWCGQHIVFKI